MYELLDILKIISILKNSFHKWFLNWEILENNIFSIFLPLVVIRQQRLRKYIFAKIILDVFQKGCTK